MRIYVAGPYSNRPGISKPGDIEEADQLRRLRLNYPLIEFVRPYDIKCVDHSSPPQCCLRVDCTELLNCDAIVLRPGWSTSKGAMLELTVAVGTGIPVYTYLDGLMYDPETNLIGR